MGDHMNGETEPKQASAPKTAPPRAGRSPVSPLLGSIPPRPDPRSRTMNRVTPASQTPPFTPTT
jgi:hypothetical protein